MKKQIAIAAISMGAGMLLLAVATMNRPETLKTVLDETTGKTYVAMGPIYTHNGHAAFTDASTGKTIFISKNFAVDKK